MKKRTMHAPHSGGTIYARAVAEKALGRRLTTQEQVHHVDEDPYNNEPSNLVICPDYAYHRLLHVRTAALEASGYAHWRKCHICGKHDNPDLMYFSYRGPNSIGQYWHRECQNEAVKARYRRQRGLI